MVTIGGLVAPVRIYGKYIVVLDLDTPVEELVKKVMLLVKGFNRFRFVCGLYVFPREASVSVSGIDVDLMMCFRL